MFTNSYLNGYSPQVSIDRINNQMTELEKMKQQIQQSMQQAQQPTNVTQNFQLAPTNVETIRYANSIEEVQRNTVVGDTPFFSRDMSVVWVKNSKNEIKTYELSEIIPKDNKDLQIEYLQLQIEELKRGMNRNDESTSNVNGAKTTTDTTRDDEPIGETIESKKSSSVSTISASKKK